MDSAPGVKQIEILLVEDNPGDVRLTREALKDSKLVNKLHVVGDGDEALAFLHKQNKHANAPRPDLIVLDLNLPKKSGLEVLAEIKEDPDLKCIPVVVLTISKSEAEVLQTYNLQANCFISKPIGLEEFLDVVKSIEEFWLSIVRLPPKSQRSAGE